MRLDAVWYVAAVPNTRLSFGTLVRGGGLMRRVLVLTVVVATSVLFGAQSAHTRKGISKARLASAMLALSDMPTGWATVSIDPSDVEPTNNGACNTPSSFRERRSSIALPLLTRRSRRTLRQDPPLQRLRLPFRRSRLHASS